MTQLCQFIFTFLSHQVQGLRLWTAKKVSGAVTRFYYDGDGARIVQVTEDGTTIYVGECYEEFLPGETWTPSAGSAMLDGGGYAMLDAGGGAEVQGSGGVEVVAAAGGRAPGLMALPAVLLSATEVPRWSGTLRLSGGDIVVTWYASDPAGGSGLAACTVEMRDGDGDWQPFSPNCSGPDTYAGVEPGHLYTFRLTAVDNVGNVATTEAQAGVRRVTKYYYHNGQRVAMRRPCQVK